MNQISTLSRIVLLVAGIYTLSCSKLKDESATIRNADGSITYKLSVSMDASTKALSIDGIDLNKYFNAGEQIAVIYTVGSTKKVATSDALTSSDIRRDGKYAKFTVTLEDTPSSGTPVEYIYPASMATADGVNYDALEFQDGTLASIASNRDLGYYKLDGFSGSFPTNFTLTNPLAICKFTVKNWLGTNITADLLEMTIDDGTNEYIINPFSSLNAVYVAMRPVSSGQTLSFTAADGSGAYETSVTGKTLSSSNLYPISMTMWRMGAFFSIGSGNRVYFSPGNLQAVFAEANNTSCTWQFAPTQYSCIGNATANKKVGNGSVTTAGTVDLFGWVSENSSLAAYGVNNTSANNQYGNKTKESLKSDWSVAANAANLSSRNHWHTLTSAEWNYLFNRKDFNNRLLYGHGSVNGVHGMILLPDYWEFSTSPSFTSGNSEWANDYTITEWQTMEVNGAVFLPAAGKRSGTSVTTVGSEGAYWSSTSVSSSNAYCSYFNSGSLNSSYSRGKSTGYSVRLVRPAE